jgi:ABC-type transport system involved in multi-copper enzyme maturation permease subunit
VKLESYSGYVSRNNDELKKLMTYQNLKPTIYKPPEILSIFSKGFEENTGNSIQISIDEAPEIASAAVPKYPRVILIGLNTPMDFPETASTTVSKNPLLAVFPVLDVTLVFKLVISVLALLLAYDSISGEKEDGTLKLMLASGIPRHQVLLGKLVGGMITLAIPIAVGFLMISLILEFSPTVEMTGNDWMRIALMFLFSLIMVSLLFNLGLLISSVTRHASDTIMFLLFIWVLFVLVIPNGSAYLAEKIKTIEPREKIARQVQEIWWGFQGKIMDFWHSGNVPPDDTIQSDASEPWGGYYRFASKNLIQYKQKLDAFAEPLRIKYANDAWRASKAYLESLKRQKDLADLISKFSPISLYEELITSLSRTDVPGSERFANQAREYRQQIIDYMYNKKAFSSLRYFTTAKEEYMSDITANDYDLARKKYDSVEPRPLDVSDVPQFHYRPEGVADTMNRILPDVLILCFISILLFMCAFISFMRCDVK